MFCRTNTFIQVSFLGEVHKADLVNISTVSPSQNCEQKDFYCCCFESPAFMFLLINYISRSQKCLKWWSGLPRSNVPSNSTCQSNMCRNSIKDLNISTVSPGQKWDRMESKWRLLLLKSPAKVSDPSSVSNRVQIWKDWVCNQPQTLLILNLYNLTKGELFSHLCICIISSNFRKTWAVKARALSKDTPLWAHKHIFKHNKSSSCSSLIQFIPLLNLYNPKCLHFQRCFSGSGRS